MALNWWLWLLFGFLLLVLELMTPGGFYVLFFGVGAIVVGLLAAVDMAGPAWMQWLLFGAISAGTLLFFRERLQKKLGKIPGREVDTMVGEIAVALTDIGIGEIGKVELRGSAWTGQNVSDRAILTGQRCRVERIEGLTLYVGSQEER